MPARIQRRQIKRLQTADWPVKDTKHRARLSCNNKKAGKLPEDGKNIDYMLK